VAAELDLQRSMRQILSTFFTVRFKVLGQIQGSSKGKRLAHRVMLEAWSV